MNGMVKGDEMQRRIYIAGLCLLALWASACTDVNPNDRLVWEVFVDISRPTGGGQPNESPVGWRLWPTQTEIYPIKNPPKPEAPPSGIYSKFRTLACDADAQEEKFHTYDVKFGATPPCFAVFLNQAASKYILDNRLYTRIQMIGAAKSAGGIHLPMSSSGGGIAREIKTEWVRIDPSRIARYIVAMLPADGGGQPVLLGLGAINLMTHEKSDWIWATWIHEDYVGQVPNTVGFHDSFGAGADRKVSPALTLLLARNHEPFLRYYKLIGSQANFEPKTLGNPRLEGKDLKCSSCMGCHRYAAVTGTGGWQPPEPCDQIGANPPPPDPFSTDFDFTLTSQPKCLGAPRCQEALEVK
jgi:hypothetical protein